MSDFGAATDPYEDLPEDPEEAFLKLEAHFFAECERKLDASGQNDRIDIIYVNYIAKVLAAIKALELVDEFRSEVPAIEDVDFNTYLNFNKDVMHYCTMLKIRRSQREQGYSVQFDETARRKIHHHLDQVMEIFGKLEIDDRKRDKLISRLNELQSEVNHRRTRFDRFAALTMEVSGVLGDAAERSKLIDILDAVGRVFWGSQTEKQKQLPAPNQKKLEAPKPKIEKKPSDMDDDIPF